MEIIRLRVNMKNVTPKVVRSLLVPLDILLDDLHITFQGAFGWRNVHLYSFETQRTEWLEESLVRDALGRKEAYSLNDASLRDFLTETGATKFEYFYDFNHCWEHVVHPGKIQHGKVGELYPKLTKVKGRCPPEDVGGPWGYEEFLEVMADEDHLDHDEFAEWCLEDEYDVHDTKEKELQDCVDQIAKLIERGKPAHEFFGFEPSKML